MKKTTHVAYRSAETGLFVTQRYAKMYPSKTVKEAVPNPGHSPAPKAKP